MINLNQYTEAGNFWLHYYVGNEKVSSFGVKHMPFEVISFLENFYKANVVTNTF